MSLKLPPLTRTRLAGAAGTAGRTGSAGGTAATGAARPAAAVGWTAAAGAARPARPVGAASVASNNAARKRRPMARRPTGLERWQLTGTISYQTVAFTEPLAPLKASVARIM